MSYKIAVASSDGKQIDETFGSAGRFIIYEVAGDVPKKLEEREFDNKEADQDAVSALAGCNPSGGCGNAGGGGCGAGGGCGGAGEVSAKVELISDCRCIVCRKIGFHIQKQLEQRAISAFDVNCSVEEALEKISYYFGRMDNHKSLRVQRN